MEHAVSANTISNIIRIHSQNTPRAHSLHGLNRRSLEYCELYDFCNRTAAALAELGIRAGDNIAIALPNGPEMATAFLSVTHLATAAPLNPGLKVPEFAFYLKDLEARALIVMEPDVTGASAAARSLGVPVVAIRPVNGAAAGIFSLNNCSLAPKADSSVVKPNDIALVLHTSGTTAKPKIVPLTHENLCVSAANVAETLQLVPEDRCLNVMPLFHIHGLVAALLASLVRGSSIICTTGYQAPEFFPWLRDTSPTWYTAVPTMHQAILARSGEKERKLVSRSRLRFVRSSSASLPPSVLLELEKSFGVPVIEAYGMTEAAHQMASNPLPPSVRKPGSVGPSAGPEVAIADADGKFMKQGQTGEVVIRGRNVTGGYSGQTDQAEYFIDKGWFRTGDQGYLDEDGYLFLTGRLKEIINRGGETIAPREIDEALLEHAAVLQAVAFAVPDPNLGEEVAAAVILKEADSENEAGLQAYLDERLSWARMPKRILILEEIPKGPTGKLQRIGLAEKLGLESIRPEPDTSRREKEEETIKRSDATIIETVARHWCDILKIPTVNPDDSFLEIGGDSLTATMLVVQLEEEFSVKLPLAAFFDAATIKNQAALIDQLLRD
jgi:acyl-CoA synthetase (AMP-forming)/AMP-acid ligase II/acyl carrier protein